VLDARGLLATADRGLYAAKAAGRDRVSHAVA
jgi:PleD family two-component response regulator